MINEPHLWQGALPVLSAAQMRAAELDMVARGTSLAVLMERAGAALADLVWRAAAGRPVLVLVGPGNNGGDGYVAARLLAERGAAVRVAALAPPGSELALRAAALWSGGVEAVGPELAPAPVIVDALYGTGGRALDPALYAVAARLMQGATLVIAADLPSGISADSGTLRGPALSADITLAFGALKPAHLLEPAASHCGSVRVAMLGIEAASGVSRLGRPPLAGPSAHDHKYSRGMVAVIGGAMVGAAELAARGALRGGAGYVVLHGSRLPPSAPFAIVRRSLPAADVWDERVGAVVIGPGLGQGEGAEAGYAAARASGKPLVIDADALPLFARKQGDAPAVLTPHAGEFARLWPQGGASKLSATQAAATHFGCVILHKGADTVIAAPDGRAVIADRAPAWLATAGTGDVLAGLCGAMLARGLDPFAAACAATALHTRAARRAGPGLCADDLVAGPNSS